MIQISENGILYIDCMALMLLTDEEYTYLRKLGKSLKERG